MGREHQSGCVLLSAASEYDGRDGALRDGVVQQLAGWRGELQKAVAPGRRNRRNCAPIPMPTQLAFEIYALMLGLHHDAGLFGFDEASAPHARAAVRAPMAQLANLRNPPWLPSSACNRSTNLEDRFKLGTVRTGFAARRPAGAASAP